MRNKIIADRISGDHPRVIRGKQIGKILKTDPRTLIDPQSGIVLFESHQQRGGKLVFGGKVLAFYPDLCERMEIGWVQLYRLSCNVDGI